MSSYPCWVTNRPLDAEEIALLRAMVDADEVAARQGVHNETFAVALLNGGVTFLDHKGFGGERPIVSRRAVVGLRDAGLFMVVSETRHLLRVYLARDAGQRLNHVSSADGIEPATTGMQPAAHSTEVASSRVGVPKPIGRQRGARTGSSSVFPADGPYVANEYRRIRQSIGYQPSQAEFINLYQPPPTRLRSNRVEPAGVSARSLARHLERVEKTWEEFVADAMRETDR